MDARASEHMQEPPLAESDMTDNCVDHEFTCLEEDYDNDPFPAAWDVEDFSPEWWDLVKTCPMFRDYWIQGYADAEDISLPDAVSDEADEFFFGKWAKNVDGLSCDYKAPKKAEAEPGVIPFIDGEQEELSMKIEALKVNESMASHDEGAIKGCNHDNVTSASQRNVQG